MDEIMDRIWYALFTLGGYVVGTLGMIFLVWLLKDKLDLPDWAALLVVGVLLGLVFYLYSCLK